MSALLLTDGRIVTADGVVDGGWLLAQGGRIVAYGPGQPDGEGAVQALDGALEVVDAGHRWILPGCIDVHVHGALGHETMDGDPEGIRVMAAYYAAHGVTSFLATTWTGGNEETLQALHATAEVMRAGEAAGATVLGAHMEGPYLNPARCGAQDVALIRDGDLGELEGFLDTGVVRLMTVAPEMPGNLEVVRRCVERGVVVSAGHTDATYAQMVQAVDAGVSHVTHAFNAMRPLHHREPGTVGAAMALEELTVELIADGIHVHPVVMRALYDVCGPRRLVLVTDAIRAAGMPPGTYPIGERTVTVEEGAVRLADGGLAGSVLTMDRALHNLCRATGASLAELWPTVSRNAASVLGVDDRKGELAVGRDADLVIIDDEGGVALTVVDGRVVHRADPTVTDQGGVPPRSVTDRTPMGSP